jgi:hypothetical protein
MMEQRYISKTKLCNEIFYQLLMWFWPANRMSLRPGLLLLTLNLALIIQCLSRNNVHVYTFFLVPSGVRVSQVEHHWCRKWGSLDISQPYGPPRPVSRDSSLHHYRSMMHTNCLILWSNAVHANRKSTHGWSVLFCARRSHAAVWAHWRYIMLLVSDITLAAILLVGAPCGGGLEYLHRSPASRKRRQKGNPVPGGITGPPCSWGI